MTKKIDDIVITSAFRTPIGTYKGSLKEFSADKLGTICIKEIIKHSKLKSSDVGEVHNSDSISLFNRKWEIYRGKNGFCTFKVY